MTRNRWKTVRKRTRRLTVERIGDDCLDVNELRRARIFGWEWTTRCPSLRYPRIVKLHGIRYRMILELRDQMVPQSVRVSWTRCRFGGERPWLHCPHCQRRVVRLFRGLAGYFCRPCVGNPIYASQGKSAASRRHFAACKLRLLLGGEASLTAPFPARPRGMRRATYDRLRQRAEKLEEGLSARIKGKEADYPSLVYYLHSPLAVHVVRRRPKD